ncbi:ADAMTSL5 [Branchiostoma lanceolatum]|uniref:ADAMTSL5 protein n=1 Tax=Branchiostoma lanceolatum TaxID=7740 RepID=A0A8K0EP70_BRALA|nr:ADAMTSL5 [Branchiostoma lanceolatum]
MRCQLLMVALLSWAGVPTGGQDYNQNRYYRQYGGAQSPRSQSPRAQGEGGSVWTQWTGWSQCSRTCGGGASVRTRKCVSRPGSEGSPCEGEGREYRVCNKRECGRGAVDYRAMQCSLHNNRRFLGRLIYRWEPHYVSGGNPCELNCMASRYNFYFGFGKVLDGTRCYADPQKKNMCIAGKCLKVGCDGILGSEREEDACRVCGGNNATCVNVRKAYMTSFPSSGSFGYNEVAMIPAGAMHLKVEDTSRNYLALMRQDETSYVINGNWIIDWPGVYDVRGMPIRYERSAENEVINSVGPIPEDLHLMVLFRETNPGIHYEFWLPLDRYNTMVRQHGQTYIGGGGHVEVAYPRPQFPALPPTTTTPAPTTTTTTTTVAPRRTARPFRPGRGNTGYWVWVPAPNTGGSNRNRDGYWVRRTPGSPVSNSNGNRFGLNSRGNRHNSGGTKSFQIPGRGVHTGIISGGSRSSTGTNRFNLGRPSYPRTPTQTRVDSVSQGNSQTSSRNTGTRHHHQRANVTPSREISRERPSQQSGNSNVGRQPSSSQGGSTNENARNPNVPDWSSSRGGSTNGNARNPNVPDRSSSWGGSTNGNARNPNIPDRSSSRGGSANENARNPNVPQAPDRSAVVGSTKARTIPNNNRQSSREDSEEKQPLPGRNVPNRRPSSRETVYDRRYRPEEDTSNELSPARTAGGDTRTTGRTENVIPPPPDPVPPPPVYGPAAGTVGVRPTPKPTKYDSVGCLACRKIKGRFKNFCRSDFVVRVLVMSSRVYADSVRYDVKILYSFKNTFPLISREFIWVDGVCPCPKLVARREYVVMGSRSVMQQRGEARLVIGPKSWVRPWRESLFGIMEQFRRKSCQGRT